MAGKIDRALRVARRARAEGGAADDELAQRIADYERMRAEREMAPEDVRLMTHLPEKPRAPIAVEGGYIGKRQLGTAPYDVASGLSRLAQTAYDLKTLPFYAVAPQAAAASDIAEGVISGDPVQAGMSAIAPGRAVRAIAGPAVAAAAMSPSEAQAAKAKVVEQALKAVGAGKITASPLETLRGVDLIAKDPRAATTILSERDPFGSIDFGQGINQAKYTFAPKGDLQPWKEFDPAQAVRERGVITGLLGDRSAAGSIVHEIGDVKLTEPVVRSGGGEFKRSLEGPEVWASRPAAVKNIYTRINKNMEEQGVPKDAPVFATNVVSGLPSIDSTQMMAKAILRQITPTRGRIDPEAAKIFDAAVRRAYPEWPGILNPVKAEKFLAQKEVGKRTSTILQNLDKQKIQAGGLPNLGAARFAMMEPRLVSAPQGSTGFAVSRLDPNRVINAAVHDTYPVGMLGPSQSAADYMGGTRYQIPLSVMFPDWWKEIKPTYVEKKSGLTKATTPTNIQQSVLTQIPMQRATQEWLDNLMRYIEQNPRKWGYQTGGSVVDRALAVARGNYEDGGAPMRDEDVYGPANLEERRARVQALSEAQRQEYPGDVIEAPQGFITPAAATSVKTTELGPVPVGAGGEELSWIRQPAVLPLYRDPTAGVRSAMPGFLDVLGNVQAAPAGVAAVNLARNVMRGERPAANIASAMGAQAPAYERSLTPLGLYSKGEETAATLPQAKGTPEQYAAMLQRAGVKPIEMEGFAEAFAGRPNVTREEIARYFRERMPVVEERVLGTRTKGQPYPEKYIKIEQDIMDRYRDELNRLTSIHMDYAQPRSVRDDAFKKYNNLINKRDFEIDDAIPNREELIQAARDTVVPTKFGEYTLPGGENYREVLLKTPVKEPEGLAAAQQKANDLIKKTADAMSDWKRTSEELAPGSPETLEKYRVLSEIRKERDVAVGELNRLGKEKRESIFQSSHWGDPNVLAHLRMSDRTGPNGEKILHVEEVQSDWGQQGKRRGFAGDREPDQKTGNWQVIHESDQGPVPYSFGTEQEARNWTQQLRDMGLTARDPAPEIIAGVEKQGTVAAAPYVTSTQGWTDLALKRALKEAAEGGYDKLVWTPGAEQAKRYDLSQQISRIGYQPELGMLYAVDKNGVRVPALEGKTFAPKDLPEAIGKEATDRLLSAEKDSRGYHMLTGDDLSLGGEGMKAYYDRILPKRLQDIVRRHDKGAKVQMMEGILPDNITAPGIVITPAMRESILKGQPHMRKGGRIARADGGAISQDDGLSQRAADLVRETSVLARYADIDAPRSRASPPTRRGPPPRSPDRAVAGVSTLVVRKPLPVPRVRPW